MGYLFADQYSLLHFASGVIAFFWGIPLWVYFVLHVVFEVIENQPWMINFIDNNITWWPGGKQKSDTVLNQVGDTLFGIVGWYCSMLLDKYMGNVYEQY